MSLSSLKLTNDKRPTPAFRANPTEKARAAILAAIEVQRVLVNAERTGTLHNITKVAKSHDESGNVVSTTVQRKPRKWFWKNPQGVFIVEVLFSNQGIVIANGKSAIEAGDLNGVDAVLNTIADAVASGELDKSIMDAKSKRKPRSKKTA